MAQYEPEQLGFIDKYLKDERTSSQRHRRLRKGTCTVKKGLLTIDGMVSNTIVEGSMTCMHFLEYLELEVVLYCYLSIYMHD
ncbi:hypothetical protein K443DRAFT_90892 [Laccaria amethystina LaAM-08-1]|uniref:Uncharacterized protein n=1 Tax=Laccaria amethystina LaAM-08-1 TaxID=1095629 RepID=A0A0C9XVN8_9AGAR|nr:hypothetical protein K443DRAFT_90892 [Laccaria amethystina LaAM-08-1]